MTSACTTPFFRGTDLGRVVSPSVLRSMSQDNVEQFVVLDGFLPRQGYIEGKPESAKFTKVRIDALLIGETLLPGPVRRCKTGAGVDDAAVRQPVPVGNGEPVKKSTMACTGSRRTNAISKGLGPDRNGTIIGTS